MGALTLSNFDLDLEQRVSTLCTGTISLLKSGKEDDEAKGTWEFAGIASDEQEDVDGDEILKKSLDLSYAQKRGYVNWDHSREPEHQLGVLRKASVLGGDDFKRLSDKYEIEIPETASVYMEGELYRYVPKAVEVQKILKSTPKGMPGLGMSLDGVVARDNRDQSVIRAFVRGVAITPVPAQPYTLAMLKKRLREESSPTETLGNFLTLRIDAREVVGELKKALERESGAQPMDFDQAVVWLLKQRPNFTYDLASKVVRYAIQERQREGAQ